MKNDYYKNYFWVHTDKQGRKTYYFNIKGAMIKVNQNVFNVCYSSYKKQLRQQNKDIDANLVSFQDINREGVELANFVGDENNYINDIYRQDLIGKIMKCINELNDKDRELIIDIFIKEKTEKKLSKQFNVTQQYINKRKHLIIKKLRRKLFEQ